MSLLYYLGRFPGHSFQWSVFVDIIRSKCGQTSRFVAGPAIQTVCNTEASWCNFNLFLACESGSISDVSLLEFFYCFKSDNCNDNIVFNNLSLLLHEDLPSPPSSSSSNTSGPCSPRATEQSRNSTQHSKIPKDCFCSTVGPNNISGLLSSICRISIFKTCFLCWQGTSYYWWKIYNNSSALEFESEPVSVLLEDQRSETSSEGHTHTVLFV